MKSQKELAFLQDLYVAPDWGERFAALVDAHVALPKEGRLLYVEAGSGEHALAIQARAGKKVQVVCVDQNEESLKLARLKAVALQVQTTFQREDESALSFEDDQFDLVLDNASLTLIAELKSRLAEMVRVARPGGTIGWWLPTFS